MERIERARLTGMYYHVGKRWLVGTCCITWGELCGDVNGWDGGSWKREGMRVYSKKKKKTLTHTAKRFIHRREGRRKVLCGTGKEKSE